MRQTERDKDKQKLREKERGGEAKTERNEKRRDREENGESCVRLNSTPLDYKFRIRPALIVSCNVHICISFY